MPQKRSLWINNVKYPNHNIQVGQWWIRKKSNKNSSLPFKIKIASKVDSIGLAFEVFGRDDIYPLRREHIVENYDLRSEDLSLTIDQQVAEIHGWRFERNLDGVQYAIPPATGEGRPDKIFAENVPKYTKSMDLCDKLLVKMADYTPDIRVKLGKYEIILIKNGNPIKLTGKTKQEVICKGFVEIYGR